MSLKVIIWDNDGTVMGSKDPTDASNMSKVILPNVKKIMGLGQINVICSGCKTPESELQNFDPEKIISKFKDLMDQLPIQMAIFSPAIGGTECYVVSKLDADYEIYKAHEDPKYYPWIGEFKKPGTGMLRVILDRVSEKLEGSFNPKEDMLMIGDTWHDQEAAAKMGIPFVEEQAIHKIKDIKDLKNY